VTNIQQHPQHFEPSPAELQIPDTGKGKGKGKEVDTGASRGRVGRDRGGVKSTAIRAVEVGEFVMEAWIEEARAKFDSQDG
jgi:mitotic spindle assembly checkpoint protein MAD2B